MYWFDKRKIRGSWFEFQKLKTRIGNYLTKKWNENCWIKKLKAKIGDRDVKISDIRYLTWIFVRKTLNNNSVIEGFNRI